MNLKESISFKHTAAPNKIRKTPGYWNWPDLVAMAELAVSTGMQQSGPIQGGAYYAVVVPDWGVTERCRTVEYMTRHEKVRIVLYAPFFTIHAERGEMISPNWLDNKESK